MRLKRTLPVIFCAFLFVYLLGMPQQALSSVRHGLLLWYHSVVPTLFPFLLLTNLLLRLQLIDPLLPLLQRPFSFLFHCSGHGAFAILCGFTSGFPMGAKITRTLLDEKKLSYEEACHLIGFVNNPGPAFLLAYVAADQWQHPKLGLMLLGNVYGSALLYGILSSFRLRRDRTLSPKNATSLSAPDQPNTSPVNPNPPLAEPTSQCRVRFPCSGQKQGSTLAEPQKQWRIRFQRSRRRPGTTPARNQTAPIFAQIDACIEDAVSATVRLGVYLMLFSILTDAAALLIPSRSPAGQIFLAALELTNGIHLLTHAALPFPAQLVLLPALASFGGCSVIAQSIGMARMDRGLLRSYLKSRLGVPLISCLLSLGVLMAYPDAFFIL